MTRTRKANAAMGPAVEISPMNPAPPLPTGNAQTTGRFVVIFKDKVDGAAAASALSKSAGIKDVVSSAEYEGAGFSAEDLAGGGAAYFPQLGICIVSADSQQMQSMSMSADDTDGSILAIEPEYIAYASVLPHEAGLGSAPLDYLRGYRDAVNHLYDQLTGATQSRSGEAEIMEVFQDNAQFTWGLLATRVNTSPFSGQGVKVAILDTGFDLQHPDFVGRPIISQTFVAGQAVQDGFGHGTHCAGTACGPQHPNATRRYGIAYNAQMYIGKVLSNQGSGATGGIIAGIEWAMGQGCRIVSMSLGANINQKILQYEVPIRRALAAGTLVIAAAGNNANRSAGNFGFVTPPANADAAMAVAALNSHLAVADFSARSSVVTGEGGKVNIAGPGVNVFSSWPMTIAPTRYNTISGTSMATPHVAGIAALWSQATGLTGAALWTKITQTARSLIAPSVDVGSGLVQAPQ